jgi:AraC-like DNA-binding protein
MPRTAKQPELTESQAFAQRLRAALTAADVAVSPTAVQRKFNAVSGDVPLSVHAVRKWIMGESIPTQDRVRVLAAWLGVSPNWLRFGEAVAKGDSPTPSAEEYVLLRSFRRLGAQERRQILALVQTMAGKRSKR